MGIKQFPVYGTNPFESKGVEEKFVGKKEMFFREVSSNTGEVIGDVPVTMKKQGRMIYHDSLAYIKVFKDGLVVLKQLDAPAREVLFYIFEQIKPRQETIRLHHTMFPKLGKARYYIGLIQLLQLGALAKAKWNEFYINPNMFFNGDRTRVFRNNKNKA